MLHKAFEQTSEYFGQAGPGTTEDGDQHRAPARTGTRTGLSLLGRFRLASGATEIPVGPNGQRLLALLACREGPVLRRQAACLLWPDAPAARAFANLRMTVYRLERRCPGVITATSTYLAIADDVRVDIAHTRRIARLILCTSGAPAPDLVAAAVRANWCDDLLPEWHQEWLVEYRTRYRQLRLATLERLAHDLSATGNHGAAVHLALTAVQADALRDSAHKTLIEAFIAQGNRHDADTHFAAYQRIFRDELGIETAGSIDQLLRSA